MKASELSRSNYLKKEDVMPPLRVTIASVIEEKVKNTRTNKDEDRWVMHFEELEKGLILNVANGSLLTSILGSDDSDDWIGKVVVLYNNLEVNNPSNPKDPGGVRVRAVKSSPAQQMTPPPPPPEEDDNDIPF